MIDKFYFRNKKAVKIFKNTIFLKVHDLVGAIILLTFRKLC